MSAERVLWHADGSLQQLERTAVIILIWLNKMNYKSTQISNWNYKRKRNREERSNN